MGMSQPIAPRARSLLAVVLAIALGVGLTACGGGDTSTSNTSGAPPFTVPTQAIASNTATASQLEHLIHHQLQHHRERWRDAVERRDDPVEQCDRARGHHPVGWRRPHRDHRWRRDRRWRHGRWRHRRRRRWWQHRHLDQRRQRARFGVLPAEPRGLLSRRRTAAVSAIGADSVPPARPRPSDSQRLGYFLGVGPPTYVLGYGWLTTSVAEYSTRVPV